MSSDDRVTWSAKIPPQRDEELQQHVEERGLNKSDVIKESLDNYLEAQNSFSWAEEQLLDVATYSAVSTLVLVAAVALRLVPYSFWQLGVVLLAIAATAAATVRFGVLDDE